MDFDEESQDCEWDEALSVFDIDKAIASINDGDIAVEKFLNTFYIDKLSGECCSSDVPLDLKITKNVIDIQVNVKEHHKPPNCSNLAEAVNENKSDSPNVEENLNTDIIDLTHLNL